MKIFLVLLSYYCIRTIMISCNDLKILSHSLCTPHLPKGIIREMWSKAKKQIFECHGIFQGFNHIAMRGRQLMGYGEEIGSSCTLSLYIFYESHSFFSFALLLIVLSSNGNLVNLIF